MKLFKKYTLGDLMMIDSGRQERAGSCLVTLEKTYHELKKATILDKFKSLFKSSAGLINSYYVIFRFRVISGSGGNHIVIIKTTPDFDLVNWENNRAWVYCDCQDFKFRSAYILNQHESLFLTDKIKMALGQAITDKPKGGTSLLCKHSFAAIRYLIQNYSSIMRTI